MTNETKKLIERVAAQAPKEFMRVKRRRNYLGLAMLAVLASNFLFERYQPLQNIIAFIALEIFLFIILLVALRETWKCPVCYEKPGDMFSNPKFCNACGSKLEG